MSDPPLRSLVWKSRFTGSVLIVFFLLMGLVVYLSWASPTRHLSHAARVLSEATTPGNANRPPELSVAFLLSDENPLSEKSVDGASPKHVSALKILDDMLEAQNAVCSHFGSRATYALYGGLIATAFIAHLLLRKKRDEPVKLLVLDAKVHPRVALLILLGAIVWMWILFGYCLGSALTSKSRSVILAGSIDAYRCQRAGGGDKEALYRLSALHSTERGEIVDILFAATKPKAWGVPLGGNYQYAASYVLFLLTYALALGLMHAAAALAIGELGRSEDKLWKRAACVLATCTALVMAGTYFHFASEFPELQLHLIFIIGWGLVITLFVKCIVMPRVTEPVKA